MSEAPSSCCVCMNKVLMFFSGVAALAGSIMVWAGGIGVYKLDIAQMQLDGTFAGVGVQAGPFPFASCQDYYNMFLNNVTSPSYIENDVLRATATAQCVAPQAPMILLAAFTGLFVLGTAVAGLWASCKYSRGAVFSSGISIGYTVALLIASLAQGLYSFGTAAAYMTDCRKFSSADIAKATGLGITCVKGHTAAALPTMLVQSDTVTSLQTFLTRVAVFFVGVVFSLLSVFALKYLTTSAYHNQSETEAAEQQKLVSTSAANQYSAPALYPPVSGR